MSDGADSGWLLELIDASSYAGVALLMFAETVFPPIPSEVVMPLVGFVAAEGRLSLAGGIASATAGSLGGAFAWFLAARRVGTARFKRVAARHGRWLTISPSDVDRVNRWFERHGAVAVLIGRLIPAMRTLISVPAGISGMSTGRFLVWTGVGTSLWSACLAGIGFALGSRYEEAVPYVSTASNVVLVAALLLYVYRVVTFKEETQTGSKPAR